MRRAWPLLVLLLLGCEDGPLPPSRVDSLRVLAVVAEPPEAAPGTDVALFAEVANPEGVSFTARWHACAAEERNVSEAVLQYGGRVPDGGCPVDAPLRVELPGEGVTQTLPGATTAAALELARAADARVDALLEAVGVPLVVQITLEDPAGRPLVVAYKRVGLTTRSDPSTNPPAPTLRFGATPLEADSGDCGEVTVAVGETVALSPSPDEAWLERHPRLRLDGSIGEADEVAYYSWFATDGALDTPITVAPARDTDWTAPAAATDARLWVVVRDGHLGASFCRFTARVR